LTCPNPYCPTCGSVVGLVRSTTLSARLDERERQQERDAVLLRAERDAALYLVRQARDAFLSEWETPVHRAGWMSRATTLLDDQKKRGEAQDGILEDGRGKTS